MAIIFADFPSGQTGLYGTDRDLMLNGIWAAFEGPSSGAYPTLVADPDPNIAGAGRVLRCDNTSGAVAGARFALPAGETDTVGIGFRLWMSALPSGNWASWQAPLIGFRNISNGSIAYLTVLSNGAMAVATTRDGTTLLGQTSGPVVTANAYNHIEIKCVRDAAAGEVEVRVNGVTKLELDTLALGANNIASLFIGVNYWASGNINKGLTYYKDVVFWDDAGAEGNDFQGSVAVHDLVPDGDIALNWATSTGTTGWDLIDKSPPVDTDYIQAGDPPPDPAKFSLTDLPDDVTSVRALLPIVRAVKTDGGDCNIQVGLTPNDTNWDDGADRPITTAQSYYWDVSHLSPATSAPWTPNEVNDAYVRADRTL